MTTLLFLSSLGNPPPKKRLNILYICISSFIQYKVLGEVHNCTGQKPSDCDGPLMGRPVSSSPETRLGEALEPCFRVTDVCQTRVSKTGVANEH